MGLSFRPVKRPWNVLGLLLEVDRLWMPKAFQSRLLYRSAIPSPMVAFVWTTGHALVEVPEAPTRTKRVKIAASRAWAERQRRVLTQLWYTVGWCSGKHLITFFFFRVWFFMFEATRDCWCIPAFRCSLDATVLFDVNYRGREQDVLCANVSCHSGCRPLTMNS